MECLVLQTVLLTFMVLPTSGKHVVDTLNSGNPMQGGRRILNCQGGTDPEYWYKDNEPLTIDQIHYVRSGTTLEIDGLSPRDSGYYQCGYQPSPGQGGFTLNVHYPSSGARVVATTTSPTLGDIVTLSCRLDSPGYPRPTYDWYHKGSKKYDGSTPEYTFSVTGTSTSGDYTCQPRQLSESFPPAAVSEPIHINVKVYASIFRMKSYLVTSQDNSASESYVNVTCDVTGDGVMGIQWLDGQGMPILNGGDYTILAQETIHGIFNDDQTSAIRATLKIKTGRNKISCDDVIHLKSDVTCKVRWRKEGSTVAEKPKVRTLRTDDLIYGPLWDSQQDRVTHAEVGAEDVRLRCAVCGKPSPNTARIIWTYQGGKLPESVHQSEANLVIAKMMNQHYGRYECILPNNVKTHNRVIFSMRITSDPKMLASLNKDDPEGGKLTGSNVVLIASCAGGALVLILFIALILFYRRRKSTGPQVADSPGNVMPYDLTPTLPNIPFQDSEVYAEISECNKQNINNNILNNSFHGDGLMVEENIDYSVPQGVPLPVGTRIAKMNGTQLVNTNMVMTIPEYSLPNKAKRPTLKVNIPRNHPNAVTNVYMDMQGIPTPSPVADMEYMNVSQVGGESIVSATPSLTPGELPVARGRSASVSAASCRSAVSNKSAASNRSAASLRSAASIRSAASNQIGMCGTQAGCTSPSVGGEIDAYARFGGGSNNSQYYWTLPKTPSPSMVSGQSSGTESVGPLSNMEARIAQIVAETVIQKLAGAQIVGQSEEPKSPCDIKSVYGTIFGGALDVPDSSDQEVMPDICYDVPTNGVQA